MKGTTVGRLRGGGLNIDPVMAAEMVDDAWLDHLVAEFSLPDRDKLKAAIERAAYAYTGAERLNLLRTNDVQRQLHEALRHFIEQPPQPAIFEQELLARELYTSLGAVPEKKAGRKHVGGVRSMVRELAAYWVQATGRKFTQNTAWSLGKANQKEPPTVATRFAYIVMEYLEPGRGRHLKTIAKEFTNLKPVNFL